MLLPGVLILSLDDGKTSTKIIRNMILKSQFIGNI